MAGCRRGDRGHDRDPAVAAGLHAALPGVRVDCWSGPAFLGPAHVQRSARHRPSAHPRACDDDGDDRGAHAVRHRLMASRRLPVQPPGRFRQRALPHPQADRWTCCRHWPPNARACGVPAGGDRRLPAAARRAAGPDARLRSFPVRPGSCPPAQPPQTPSMPARPRLKTRPRPQPAAPLAVHQPRFPFPAAERIPDRARAQVSARARRFPFPRAHRHARPQPAFQASPQTQHRTPRSSISSRRRSVDRFGLRGAAISGSGGLGRFSMR